MTFFPMYESPCLKYGPIKYQKQKHRQILIHYLYQKSQSSHYRDLIGILLHKKDTKPTF